MFICGRMRSILKLLCACKLISMLRSSNSIKFVRRSFAIVSSSIIFGLLSVFGRNLIGLIVRQYFRFRGGLYSTKLLSINRSGTFD